MTFAALLAGAILADRALACSQCMCGTPFPADALGGVVPMQIRYGLEERYLSKSNGFELGPGENGVPGTEQEREHRISAFVLWRPADALALLARMPYNVKEITETPLGDAGATERSRGWGDAEMLALVGLSHGPRHTLGAIAGVTAPTGSNDIRNDAGERLDTHLQPGTGAWSMTTGFNLGLATSHGGFEASLLGRLNGRSEHGYRYGNVLLYNVGYTSREKAGLAVLAQVNGRSARRDRLEEGDLGANTGGTVLYASPGLRWRSDFGFGIEGLVQVPIVESLFGDQDEHTTGRLALSISR